MKKIKLHRISALVLYAMLAITLVVSCLFFFGGEASSDRLVVMDPDMSQPAHTDLLLYWLYALLAITLIVTFVAFGWKLVDSFLQSTSFQPKGAEIIVGHRAAECSTARFLVGRQ